VRIKPSDVLAGATTRHRLSCVPISLANEEFVALVANRNRNQSSNLVSDRRGRASDRVKWRDLYSGCGVPLTSSRVDAVSLTICEF
jgi:hypothetical protein